MILYSFHSELFLLSYYVQICTDKICDKSTCMVRAWYMHGTCNCIQCCVCTSSTCREVTLHVHNMQYHMQHTCTCKVNTCYMQDTQIPSVARIKSTLSSEFPQCPAFDKHANPISPSGTKPTQYTDQKPTHRPCNSYHAKTGLASHAPHEYS